jgi:hypothetical protein
VAKGCERRHVARDFDLVFEKHRGYGIALTENDKEVIWTLVELRTSSTAIEQTRSIDQMRPRRTPGFGHAVESHDARSVMMKRIGRPMALPQAWPDC